MVFHTREKIKRRTQRINQEPEVSAQFAARVRFPFIEARRAGLESAARFSLLAALPNQGGGYSR